MRIRNEATWCEMTLPPLPFGERAGVRGGCNNQVRDFSSRRETCGPPLTPDPSPQRGEGRFLIAKRSRHSGARGVCLAWIGAVLVFASGQFAMAQENAKPVPQNGAQPVGESTVDSALRLLQSIDEEMSAAGRDLHDRKIGDGTRTRQQNAVRQLGELITMIEDLQMKMQQQQRPQPQSSPREPNPGCQPPKPQQPMPNQKPQPGEQQNPGLRRPDGPAKQSVEGADPVAAKKAEMLRQQQMLKDVWGHLPPTLRDELLNVSGDQYLPKYADQVQRYYEVLAERSRTRPKGGGF